MPFFIKLDISKAFDLVGLQYLLDVLTTLGFNTKWRNQISTVLRSSSSRFLINGKHTKNIRHAKRTETRISVVTNVIYSCNLSSPKNYQSRSRIGLLQSILPSKEKLRHSIYAHDAALFAHPRNYQSKNNTCISTHMIRN